MKQILEPLALIPGVRMAALISEDGVPIATTAGAHRSKGQEGDGEPVQPIDHDDELNAFTALAASWFGEMIRAVGQLAWSRPRRMVLRATLGELVLQQAPNAVVLVVLERGVTAEELRVPIDGAIARMQRVLRSLATRATPAPSPITAAVPTPVEAPAPLPQPEQQTQSVHKIPPLPQVQPPGPFPAAADENAQATPETLADRTSGDH